MQKMLKFQRLAILFGILGAGSLTGCSTADYSIYAHHMNEAGENKRIFEGLYSVAEQRCASRGQLVSLGDVERLEPLKTLEVYREGYNARTVLNFSCKPDPTRRVTDKSRFVEPTPVLSDGVIPTVDTNVPVIDVNTGVARVMAETEGQTPSNPDYMEELLHSLKKAREVAKKAKAPASLPAPAPTLAPDPRVASARPAVKAYPPVPPVPVRAAANVKVKPVPVAKPVKPALSRPWVAGTDEGIRAMAKLEGLTLAEFAEKYQIFYLGSNTP